jgi:hypothetical protein
MTTVIHFVRVVCASTVLALTLLAGGCIRAEPLAEVAPTCQLPPPPSPGTELRDFDRLLRVFVQNGCYREWERDTARRDASEVHGGWVINYYSPPVGSWLRAGRQGSLPDASLIVKEMWANASCGDYRDSNCFYGFTPMYKASRVSFDGWYWAYYAPPGTPLPLVNTIDYPAGGLGLYCLNCHASAVGESTFADPANLARPGRLAAASPAPAPARRAGPPRTFSEHASRAKRLVGTLLAPPPAVGPAAAWLETFGLRAVPRVDHVKPLPGEALDHVVSNPGGPPQFLTSDQCVGCHDATESAPDRVPAMLYPPDGQTDHTQPVLNFSPYAEAHASLMGLSGRDPVFFAQLESEGVLHAPQKASIQDTCLSCHGVMGQRQLAQDRGIPFSLDMIYATGSHPIARYGALARDGVSCAVCHHIVVRDDVPFEKTFTGKFFVGPSDELYGPYDTEVRRKPMEQALGITPKAAPPIKSAKLCGSCHAVVVDVLDRGKVVKKAFEQTTYLEWLNSSFQDEIAPIGKNARTCQGCHMPQDHGGRGLAYRIANIEDDTFPPMQYQLPKPELAVTERTPFSRHALGGINLFTQEMFRQFNDPQSGDNAILGIRTVDPMLGNDYGTPVNPLDLAIQSALELAQAETVRLAVTGVTLTTSALEATVEVANLTGHRFPSGVGFRRAFLEFQVLDPSGNVLWRSGRTSPLGVLLGTDGGPLPSEFFRPVDGKQAYQPHYEVITSQNQVQIYEELIQDCQGKFTTSFLSLCHEVKDNRLQPRGWTKDGPWAVETGPHGNATADCAYTVNPACPTYGQPSTGADRIVYRVPRGELVGTPARVLVTMYYQSLPPYYLADRFAIFKGCPDPLAPDCHPETRRLLYLAANLNTGVTINGQQPIASWKIKLASADAPVR